MIRIEDKNRAFHMKHEGFSVSDISKTLNISRNTLYLWFNQTVSPAGHRLALSGRPETIQSVVTNKKARLERLKRLNEAREEKLNKYYQMAKEEARADFHKFSSDPLFISGLMAYWVGGDRVSKYNLRLGNSDPGVLLIFASFLEKFLAVQRGKLRAQVFYDETLNADLCREFWSMNLKLDKSQFTKNIILKRKTKTKKSRYGNCNIGITSRFLKTKMLEWITIFDREVRMRP